MDVDAVALSSRVAQLCSDFDYPPSIKVLIERTSTGLAAVAPTSLVLTGSASRGEITFELMGGQPYLYSDLEYVLIGAARNPTGAIRNVQSEAARLVHPNPLFHVDCLVTSPAKLKRFRPGIFAMEMKELSIALVGEDLRYLIPPTTLENLDFGLNNHLLLVRLTHLLLHTPLRVVQRRACHTEERLFGYVVARNALELPTILLPHEGVLLSTYRRRVAYVKAHFEMLRMAARLPIDFPILLEDALTIKRSPSATDSMDILSLYRRTLDSYQALSALLEDDIRPYRLHLRQQLIERGNLLRWAVAHGPQNAVGLKSGWRKHLLHCLLHMHEALYAIIARLNPSSALEAAANHLSSVSFASFSAPDAATATERWLLLRQRYFDLLPVIYAERRNDAPMYAQLLKWTFEADD